MAVKVLTVANLNVAGVAATSTPEVATVAADGFEFTVTGDTILILQNVSAVADYKMTIKKGTAMQGVADVEVVSILRSTSQAIKLDMGKFKNLTSGKVTLIPEHVDLTCKAIRI